MRKAIFAIAAVAVVSLVAWSWFNSKNKMQAVSQMPTYIGTAVMEQDESIVLHMCMSASSLRGEGVLVYRKGDAHYQSVLDHINSGLKPGEKLLPGGREQAVKPWPLEPADESIDLSKLVINAQTPAQISTLAPAPGTTQVVKAGQVSQQFVDTVQSVVNKMPAKVRRLVKRAGIRIVAAARLTDAVPQLAGQHPRGWPPGSTFDNVDGVFHGGYVLVVADYVLRKGSWVHTTDAEGVTRHEFGHAVDAALGDFSQSRSYARAYHDDVASVPAAAQATLEYFLQPGSAGREETFAEVFASINGGNNRPRLIGYIPQYFPKTAAVVQQRLNNLP